MESGISTGVMTRADGDNISWLTIDDDDDDKRTRSLPPGRGAPGTVSVGAIRVIVMNVVCSCFDGIKGS